MAFTKPSHYLLVSLSPIPMRGHPELMWPREPMRVKHSCFLRWGQLRGPWTTHGLHLPTWPAAVRGTTFTDFVTSRPQRRDVHRRATPAPAWRRTERDLSLLYRITSQSSLNHTDIQINRKRLWCIILWYKCSIGKVI